MAGPVLGGQVTNHSSSVSVRMNHVTACRVSKLDCLGLTRIVNKYLAEHLNAAVLRTNLIADDCHLFYMITCSEETEDVGECETTASP